MKMNDRQNAHNEIDHIFKDLFPAQAGRQHLKIGKQDGKELFGVHSGDKTLFLDADTTAEIGTFAQGEGSLAEDIQI